jgi:hypothetical protein
MALISSLCSAGPPKASGGWLKCLARGLICIAAAGLATGAFATQFTINKTIDSSAATSPGDLSALQFQVSVTCSNALDENGQPANFVLASTPISVSAPAVLNVTLDPIASSPGPACGTCTVTELTPLPAAPPGCSWIQPDPIIQDVCEPNPPRFTPNNTITVANRLFCGPPPGSLKVTKLLNAPADAPTAGLQFTFNLTCSAGGPYASKTITWPTDTVTFSPIPSGATCQVTEDAPVSPNGYTFGAVQYSGTPTDAMPPGGSRAVTVTNNLIKRSIEPPPPPPTTSVPALGHLGLALLGLLLAGFGAATIRRRR